MGNWKNFDELEESLSLTELTFILDAMREKEKTQRQFEAAIQGIDLDKQSKNDPVQRRLEEVKRRAAIKQLGEEEVKREEFAVMGFGYVAEE